MMMMMMDARDTKSDMDTPSVQDENEVLEMQSGAVSGSKMLGEVQSVISGDSPAVDERDLNDNLSPVSSRTRPVFKTPFSSSVDPIPPLDFADAALTCQDSNEECTQDEDADDEENVADVAVADDEAQRSLTDEQTEGVQRAYVLLLEVAQFAENLGRRDLPARAPLALRPPSIRDIVEHSLANAHEYIRTAEPTISLFGCAVGAVMFAISIVYDERRNPAP